MKKTAGKKHQQQQGEKKKNRKKKLGETQVNGKMNSDDMRVKK